MPNATPLPGFPIQVFDAKKMIRGYRIKPRNNRPPFFIKNKDIFTYNSEGFLFAFFKKDGLFFLLDLKNAPSKS